MSDTSMKLSIDDLFFKNEENAATVLSSTSLREQVISSESYKKWFEKHHYMFTRMMQIEMSFPSKAGDDVPDYVYEHAERLYCCVSSKRDIEISDMHVSYDKPSGHVNVRFWFRHSENVYAFLNMMCLIDVFRKSIYTNSLMRYETIYGARAYIFHSDDYERSQQSPEYNRFNNEVLESILLLKHNPDHKVGLEKVTIENIAHEINSR